MLFTIIVWGSITTLCLVYGLGVQAGFSTLLNLEKGPDLSLVYICLLGLAGITSLAGIFSLFIRLSWEVNLIIVFGALGIGFWQKRTLLEKTKKVLLSSWKDWPLILILTLLTAFLVIWMRSISEPMNYDTVLASGINGDVCPE